MPTTRIWFPLAVIALTAPLFGGCGDEKKTTTAEPTPTLAPSSTALAPAKPATMDAKKLTVDRASSKVEFLMEAPQEKIHGIVDGAMTGDLNVDFMDVTKTTGLVAVDISGLVVKQAKVDDAGKISEEKAVPKQNEHVRTWLEISPDAPEDVRKKNSIVQFSITSLETTGPKDVSKMTGADRKVSLKATGDFLLHGHKTQKTAELEATFHFEGDKPVSVSVKTVKPFAVGLVEHDVKPRDAFGKFALKTLDALSKKVAQEAMVSLDYTAKISP